MKKIVLVFAMIVFATTFFVNGAYAQGAQYGNEQEIPWINYSIDIDEATTEKYPDGFYLCRIERNTGAGSVDGFSYDFVTAGGKYGTRAVLGNRGIKLEIENAGGGNYRFKGLQQNPNPNNGQYIGAGGTGDEGSLFMDQNGEFSVTPYSGLGNSEGHVYRISDMGVNSSDELTTSTSAYWLIIPRESFRRVIMDVEKQTNIEVSGLFNNTRFLRHIPEKDSWEWYDYTGGVLGNRIGEDEFYKEPGLPVWGEGSYSGTPLLLSHSGIEEKGAFRGISPYIGNSNGYPNPETGGILGWGASSYLTDKGEFGGAEMRDPIVMRQTVDGLKPGTYIITVEAFVSNDSDNPITTNAPVAYLFAAGTQGLSDGAEIGQLTDGEQNQFDALVAEHEEYFEDGDNMQYFRRNVPASEFLSDHNGDNSHLVTIAVTVTESAEGANDGTLTIGIAKASEEGRVYVDNVRVYYSGDNEFGINAYSTNYGKMTATNLSGIDENRYEFSRTFNLARDFGETAGEKVANPAWEALVLPVNLTKTQVRAAFGDDVKLCHLKGLENGGIRIQFNTVSLDGNGDDVAVYAGECYAVKVTDAPAIKRGAERHSFVVYSEDEGINNARIDYPSPIYQIAGVTRADVLGTLIESQNVDEDDVEDSQLEYSDGVVTKTYKTLDGDLKFTGYFYRPESVAAGNYVLSGGTVYHLPQPWNRLMGTMWTLQEVDAEGNVVDGNRLSFDFGDGELTGISDITTDGAEGTKMEGVYNLNGQKVSDGDSTDNLPKGIYVVGGRKVVVR